MNQCVDEDLALLGLRGCGFYSEMDERLALCVFSATSSEARLAPESP